ncbi:hypothetical protein JK358_34320 [Nocardia sp. 2]|uniref:Uncharacterized protein n=1 Tax=Nocardia acididurans TaxID=2802282 RepID=A0ABS1MII6_9NOCA|nr:hypothetical protein [Nocardia acididurans]MBL1079494.1 hypothetical protein [Nocardia acididurans]
MNATDPTQPGYYTDRAPADEHAMRADFAHAYQLERMYQSDPSEANEQLHWRANAIEDRWNDHPDEDVRQRWDYLGDAVDDWRRAPEVMHRMHENIAFNQSQGFDMVEPHQWRSQQQARELTGNGEWHPALDSGHARPVNAFAAAAAAEHGTERDGAER